MEKAQEFVVSSKPKIAQNFRARTIRVVSNHFPLVGLGDNFKIYIHAVKIEPKIALDSRGLLNRIFRAAKQGIERQYGAVVNSGWMVFSVKSQEQFTISGKIDDKQYTYSLTQVKETSINNLFSDAANAGLAKQAINIFIKDVFRAQGYKEFGRLAKFYNPDFTKEVNRDLDIMRGYFSTLKIVSDDKSITRIRPKLLLDFNSKIVQKINVRELTRNMNIKQIQEQIVGRTVITYHNNYRTYRIDGVSDNTPMSIFPAPNAQGQKQTYWDYFNSRYGIKIKDRDQSLFINIQYKRPPHDQSTKIKHEIHIVPELCYMTGLTEDMRSDYNLMRDIAIYTRLNPNDRLSHIYRGVKDINGKLQKDLNMKIDGQDNQIEGLQLSTPRIFLKGNDVIKLDNKQTNFNLRDRVILAPADLQNWVIIYAARDNRDDKEVKDFVSGLKDAAKAYGIQINNPLFERTQGPNAISYIDSLKNIVRKDNSVQILLTYLPSVFKNNYKEIKNICYQELGIPNQVVLDKAIRNRKTGKMDLSVCSKIILQMNCKLGLPLWQVDVPENLPPQTMIIGIDISKKKGKKSCLGFVASLDKYFCEFYSRVFYQTQSDQDIFANNNLDIFIESALNEYLKRNNQIPQNIIIYRDGVSEYQMNMINEYEIPKMQQGITKFKVTQNINTKINFAEIVVTKRIDDRFFTADKNQNTYNAGSGTAIINGVTNPDPNICDFYLVAQNVNQGTVTPTHYYILYNTTQLTLDTFLELTYFQCFNYQNWMGSIRVPAPCQYAHKLCLIASDVMQSEHKHSLNDTLFYL